MKKIISFLLMLVMSITLISPTQVKEAQAATNVKVDVWTVPDLMQGDTYGIYPLSWYNKGVTGTIDKGKFWTLYIGVRRKIVESGHVEEKRFAKPMIDNSLTVKEVLEAFYTLLSNYDYPVDLSLGSGMDPVSYMQQIGVYTGQNGEQGLQERCTMEQAMVIATRIVTAFYDALGASSKGFFWEVKSGGNTVYLLGSIHMASCDIYPLNSEIWKAYNNSNALFVEANLYDQTDTLALSQLMYYTDGTTLKDHVSSDTYQKAVATAALIGIPEETIASLKPWALYMTFSDYAFERISGGSNTSVQLGIDMNFLTNSVVYQKPIYAIEGLAKQGEIFDSFSAGLQEYLLSNYSNMLSDMVNGKAGNDAADLSEYKNTLFDSWKAGDTEGFKALSGEDEEEAFTGDLTDQEKAYAKEYNEKILTQRDDGMAEYIDNLLKSEGNNTYFVIVGAAHFVSDYSVIDRLEKKGYEVTQIK